jgi:hypothetical protein
MMVGTRVFLVVTGMVWVGGCVSPKAIGQTPDTDGDPTASSGDDTDDPTAESIGEPGTIVMCPDQPGMCADVDGNFCDDGAGGPADEFDADCCVRPRCDLDGVCPDGRVCVVMKGWGEGAGSSTECVPDGDVCGCGGTADGDADAAVCVLVEDAPPEPLPGQCTTESTGDALAVTPDDPALIGTASCVVAQIVDTTIDLDCTAGDFTGAITLGIGTAAPSLALAVDDIVDVTLANRMFNTREWTVAIANAAGERVVVAGDGQGLSLDGSTPPWPTGVDGVEIAAIGCPVSECGDYGAVLRARQGELSIDVAPGQSAAVPGAFDGAAPLLSVFEARRGGGGDECDPPSFGWVGYSMVVPGPA